MGASSFLMREMWKLGDGAHQYESGKASNTRTNLPQVMARSATVERTHSTRGTLRYLEAEIEIAVLAAQYQSRWESNRERRRDLVALVSYLSFQFADKTSI
jgi:hypothetical protein